jgi:hypothetical protein
VSHVRLPERRSPSGRLNTKHNFLESNMTTPKYDPLPKSDKLTALLEDRGKLKVKAKQSQAEVWRLTKLLSPQIHDETVTRTTDADEPTAAFIGIKTARDKPGVMYTGTGEQNEAARKDDILKRTLAGEQLADTTDIKAQLEKEHRQWTAYESAIEYLNREIDKEESILSSEYCKRLKPKEKELMTRICEPLLELHAAYSEAYRLKRHLIDSGIGLHGLCLTLPEFLSTPNNPHSEFGDFLRVAKREGYIKEVPSELRL